MSRSRREYFKRTRTSRLRQLKRSPLGLAAMTAALAACAVFIAASYRAVYVSAGGYGVGGAAMAALILSVVALIGGIVSRRQDEDIRLAPSNTALCLGVLLCAVLGVMYIYGLF